MSEGSKERKELELMPGRNGTGLISARGWISISLAGMTNWKRRELELAAIGMNVTDLTGWMIILHSRPCVYVHYDFTETQREEGLNNPTFRATEKRQKLHNEREKERERASG